MQQIFPDIDLRWIRDEHPTDFDSSAIWDLWMQSIGRELPETIDVVFSSEEYGSELARRLNARHICLDFDRANVPISATKIRDNPLQNWEFLPEPVRPHFVRRVAIVGAESTGKSTLSAQLAAHFQTEWVPEFASEYLRARDGKCSESDLLAIANGQVEREDEAARRANKVLLCDTNLLTTQIWSQWYFGRCDAQIKEAADTRVPALTLLMDIDAPWVDDGLRDCPNLDDRAWFYQKFLEELQARQWPFKVLSGTWDEKFKAAISAIDQLLQHR